MAELTWVGKNVPKIDAMEKAFGQAKYAADMRFPGLLYGKLLRSPYPHAVVKSIDTSKAEKLPGVVAVVTKKDAPNFRFTKAAHQVLLYPPLAAVLDQYMFDDHVRFVGDPVAAVAAVDEQTALDALKLIEVEYEELPAVFDVEEAMKSGAPQLHEGVEKNIAALLSGPFTHGDPEAGFKEADIIYEDTYDTSRNKQCQMENIASIAMFDSSGKLLMYSPTQMPHLVQRQLSLIFDLPMTKVRVVTPMIGGAFGVRLGMITEPYSALLAKVTGKPVMVELSRKEDFSGTETRHPIRIHLKIGAKKDGTITAEEATMITDAGAYATHAVAVTSVGALMLYRIYKCANVKVEGYVVYTNNPVAGAYRGYGGPQAAFALEQHLDALAEKLGMDAIEFRKRNHYNTGDIDMGTLIPITSCALAECLDKGAEAANWREKRKKTPGSDPGPKKRGLGCGTLMWASGTACWIGILDFSTAMVKVNEDGTVNILTGANDVGAGGKTALCQIAAEELGVNFNDVSISATDTDTTPFDIGAHASRTVYANGNAIRIAAKEAKRQILELAAEMLEAPAEELVARNGSVYVKGAPHKGLKMGEICYQAHIRGKQFLASANSPQTNAPPYGAQFAEVEVDTRTGRVEILKLVAAHDVGTAVNPQLVEGQIEGALQQGLGYSLTEDVIVDKETGVVVNPSFSDYQFWTAADMPPMDILLVEPDDPTGPFGAKGVGEHGLAATAAAIANAMYNATGVRFKELPMTSERVLQALKEAGRAWD
ncbi:MAG: molybdopterin-dependent oxidoreductase [Chloroflexi bacterium]|nr:molybdopterin-dependent oxidoreductase [Chloroflexota bacterium]